MDNRKPEAKARRLFLLALRRRTAPVELIENAGKMRRRYSAAGIGDLDIDFLSPHHGTDDNSALAGIAQAVGNQVLQDPAQHCPVAAHDTIGLEEAQMQALLRGNRCKIGHQAFKQRHDGNRSEGRTHNACIKFGNVQQCAEQLVHGFERALHLAGELLAARRCLQFGQC